ncbi:MAG: GIY-YIG nuclease family protein [Flavobacteriaceae bacterium]
MEYTTYIIYSVSLDRYYVGHTGDLGDRLYRRNNGESKYTKGSGDWRLVWKRVFPTRSAAMAMEREIKAKKSRKYIEFLAG